MQNINFFIIMDCDEFISWLSEAMKKYGRKNPFDNKVIVIDEVHNFVGRIK